MMTKDITEEIEKMEELSTIDIIEEQNLQHLMPKMNVSVGNQLPEMEPNNIVSDEQLVDIYSEILGCIREDRQQVAGFIDTMAEMVINEGDATSSSKEALVNLVKIKSDMTDKMSKVADLMTRVKLKDKDTFPKYLAANQNNTINISETGSRRALIEAVNKAKNKKEQNV
jgi:DNA replication initiation complex subunit (GINS family)